MRTLWAASVALIGLSMPGIAYAQGDFKQANNYLCYVVEGITTGGKEGGERHVVDQFGKHRVTLAKPRMVCNPVDLRGKAVPKSPVHFVCYNVVAGDKTPREVDVSSDLEAKTHIVLAQPQLLCVPGKKRYAK